MSNGNAQVVRGCDALIALSATYLANENEVLLQRNNLAQMLIGLEHLRVYLQTHEQRLEENCK